MIDWQLHRPSRVAELLQAHGIATSRRLGQNFLVDANILRKVVEAAELGPSDCVVEIGAGLGILTLELAERAGRVIAIEKDRRCFAALQQTTRELTNVELMHADALEVDWAKLCQESAPAKIVANLPYGISKEVLRRIFDARRRLACAVLMLQKEVTDRLTAAPGTKAYGPLAIAAAVFADTKLIATVSPTSFFPPPKVRSGIVRLRFLTEPRVAIADEERFFAVIKAALGERRKTLFNALSSSSLGVDRDTLRVALLTTGLDGQRRGETLTPGEFAALANELPSAV